MTNIEKQELSQVLESDAFKEISKHGNIDTDDVVKILQRRVPLSSTHSLKMKCHRAASLHYGKRLIGTPMIPSVSSQHIYLKVYRWSP